MSLLSIPQAADALGISETSVRRRIKAGELRAQRRATPQGHVWLVEAPFPPAEEVPAGDFRDLYIEHLEGEVATLRRVVDALLAELRR